MDIHSTRVSKYLRINFRTAPDNSLGEQGQQQILICILRLDQQVAIPVDGVKPDVVGIQRCLGIVRVDAGQLLHASCEGLALGYVQFKLQHNSLLLSHFLDFVLPDILFGSTYITLNRINSKAISR